MAGQGWRSRLARVALSLVGIVAFVAAALVLQEEVGIPFDTTFRVVCAGACLFFIARFARESPGERWIWVGFWISAVVDVAMFFTPVLQGPVSRGEIMLFGFPDAIVLLIARLATYEAADAHRRAVRQQLVLGLILGLAFCALLFGSRVLLR